MIGPDDSNQPDDGTWHHGLIARYWAEFNTAQPDELAWYRSAIDTFGEPALDLGCGTGRLLVPLLQAGVDVDGVDVSVDMLDWAGRSAARVGLAPRLDRQSFHELDLARRYRTIYCCDSFGIGGSRSNDLEALRRIHDHLAPGGAFVFSQDLMYASDDRDAFARWLPSRGVRAPREWSDDRGNRQLTADGDAVELDTRLADLDPLRARATLEIRARLWRDETMVAEEVGRLVENVYLVPELQLMLDVAGFADVEVQGRYTDKLATSSDPTVVFIARK